MIGRPNAESDPYLGVDPVLESWLPQHGLHVWKQDREWAVRIIPVVDDQGDEYAIALDPPRGNRIGVHASRVRLHDPTRRIKTRMPSPREARSWSTTVESRSLDAALEEAYSTVSAWIGERGHSRTPSP